MDRQEAETLSLPAKLSTIIRYPVEQVVNAQQPRRFGLSMRSGVWLINGRVFKLEEVAPDEVVKLHTVEAWDFINEQNPNEGMENAQLPGRPLKFGAREGVQGLPECF